MCQQEFIRINYCNAAFSGCLQKVNQLQPIQRTGCKIILLAATQDGLGSGLITIPRDKTKHVEAVSLHHWVCFTSRFLSLDLLVSFDITLGFLFASILCLKHFELNLPYLGLPSLELYFYL